jgi:hypothetical protein
LSSGAPGLRQVLAVIELNFIGKVEAFRSDFARALDHLGVGDAVRKDAAVPANASAHDVWSDYYTAELADRIYRAYECDFDRFGYPRSLRT